MPNRSGSACRVGAAISGAHAGKPPLAIFPRRWFSALGTQNSPFVSANGATGLAHVTPDLLAGPVSFQEMKLRHAASALAFAINSPA